MSAIDATVMRCQYRHPPPPQWLFSVRDDRISNPPQRLPPITIFDNVKPLPHGRTASASPALRQHRSLRRRPRCTLLLLRCRPPSLVMAASAALASTSRRQLFPWSWSTTASTTTTKTKTTMIRLSPSVMMSSSFVLSKSKTTLPAAAADIAGRVRQLPRLLLLLGLLLIRRA